MSYAPAMFTGFSRDAITFLAELAENNNKPWFEANRKRYEAGLVEPGKAFVTALVPRLQDSVPTMRGEAKVGGSIFRIHRDIRFSNDKSPYKAHFDLWFWDTSQGRAEKGWESSGFWMRLTGARLMLGAGMHAFEKEKLHRYRKAVAKDGEALARLLEGHTVGGRNYRRPPPGFSSSRPELLLHDSLYVSEDVPTPAVVHGPEFVDYCAGRFARWAPVHRWVQAV